MKKLALLAALLILAACVPEYQAPAPEQEQQRAKPVETPTVHERVIPSPYTSVWQTRGTERIEWGYDQEFRLVLLNSSTKTVVLEYADGNLVRIDDAIKPILFFYDGHGTLLSAQKGIQRWVFTYTSKGRLLTMDNGEHLEVSHNSKGLLSAVSRDGGTTTEFEYDDQNRTKAYYRNDYKTTAFYDSDGRLARLDRDDDHLVIAYWRYNLLSSLSGTLYGLKETVNYGPTSVKLVSNTEENEFVSEHPEDEQARMQAFNTFLYCTRFRKLPVLFDGQSWTLYREYFRGNITDYVQNGFICDHLP